MPSNPNTHFSQRYRGTGLAAITDHKLETEERALQNAKDVFETDKIFDSVRILGWIKYLIIEKNGRVPDSN
jgi:hypothetical protein